MTRRLFTFAVLAYAISWLAWLPLTAHALGWTSTAPSPYWHLLGGVGPASAALLLSAREGRLRDLLVRCVRAPLRWIVVAVLGPTLLFFLSAAVLRAFGAHIDLSATAQSTEYPMLGVAAYSIANIVFYGFGEEIGWRGYLLPSLQRRFTPIQASLVVVAFWALWHLPLFAFASGMSAMGAAGIVGWLASLVTGSVLMTALYNRSGGSVLPVALFHALLDILISSPTGGPLQSTMGALVTLAGIAVALRLHDRQRRAVHHEGARRRSADDRARDDGVRNALVDQRGS